VSRGEGEREGEGEGERERRRRREGDEEEAGKGEGEWEGEGGGNGEGGRGIRGIKVLSRLLKRSVLSTFRTSCTLKIHGQKTTKTNHNRRRSQPNIPNAFVKVATSLSNNFFACLSSCSENCSNFQFCGLIFVGGRTCLVGY
jgi:hypothetical protein